MKLYWAPRTRASRAVWLLEEAGVDAAEAKALLGTIEARVASGMTGARWQRECLAGLERRMSRRKALPAMFERYLEQMRSDRPVHEWPL